MNYLFFMIYSTLKREKNCKQSVGFNNGNHKVICRRRCISFTVFLQTAFFQTYFRHSAEPSMGIWLRKQRSLEPRRHRSPAFPSQSAFHQCHIQWVNSSPESAPVAPSSRDCSSSLLIKPGPFLLTRRRSPVVALSVSPTLGIGSWPPISIYALSCSRSPLPMTKTQCRIQV